MKRVWITPAARNDLQGIRAYVTRYSPAIARRLLEDIRRATVRLGEHPHIGHVREDLTPQPVRFWPVRSYLIVYDTDAESVRVLRILHGAQDVGSILTELGDLPDL